jgi:hypothetical protein
VSSALRVGEAEPSADGGIDASRRSDIGRATALLD